MRRAARAAAARGRPLRVMFADEARFGRINRPRPCWARPRSDPRSLPNSFASTSICTVRSAPRTGRAPIWSCRRRTRNASRFSSIAFHENSPGPIFFWFSTGLPTTRVATSCSPTTSRCYSFRPTRRSSTRRKMSGTKSARRFQELRPQIHRRRSGQARAGHPSAERIRVVLDNLSTHSAGQLAHRPCASPSAQHPRAFHAPPLSESCWTLQATKSPIEVMSTLRTAAPRRPRGS